MSKFASVSSNFHDDMVLVTIDPPCPSDIDGDGMVNVLDLLEVLGAWGPSWCGPLGA